MSFRILSVFKPKNKDGIVMVAALLDSPLGQGQSFKAKVIHQNGTNPAEDLTREIGPAQSKVANELGQRIKVFHFDEPNIEKFYNKRWVQVTHTIDRPATPKFVEIVRPGLTRYDANGNPELIDTKADGALRIKAMDPVPSPIPRDEVCCAGTHGGNIVSADVFRGQTDQNVAVICQIEEDQCYFVFFDQVSANSGYTIKVQFDTLSDIEDESNEFIAS